MTKWTAACVALFMVVSSRITLSAQKSSSPNIDELADSARELYSNGMTKVEEVIDVIFDALAPVLSCVISDTRDHEQAKGKPAVTQISQEKLNRRFSKPKPEKR